MRKILYLLCGLLFCNLILIKPVSFQLEDIPINYNLPIASSSISFNSNGQIASYPNINGSGTENDPYIIEGVIVEAESGVGIGIDSTTAHLIIRNCSIYGKGITTMGIKIVAPNIVIDGCSVYNFTTNGIYISSYTATIINNYVNGSQTGIYSVYSSNTLIQNNSISHCYIGVYSYSQNNNIHQNTIWNCTNIGISLYFWGSNIINNTIYNTPYGIHFHIQSFTMQYNITQNTFYQLSQYALYFKTDSGNWVKNFTIWFNNFYYDDNMISPTYQYDADNWGRVDCQFDNGTHGNYYENYLDLYPSAIEQNGIWSIPFECNTDIYDNYPLASPFWVYYEIDEPINEEDEEDEEEEEEDEEDEKSYSFSILFGVLMLLIIPFVLFVLYWQYSQEKCRQLEYNRYCPENSQIRAKYK